MGISPETMRSAPRPVALRAEAVARVEAREPQPPRVAALRKRAEIFATTNSPSLGEPSRSPLGLPE